MNQSELKERMKQFALRVVHLVESLYWMELLVEAGIIKENRLNRL